MELMARDLVCHCAHFELTCLKWEGEELVGGKCGLGDGGVLSIII